MRMNTIPKWEKDEARRIERSSRADIKNAKVSINRDLYSFQDAAKKLIKSAKILKRVEAAYDRKPSSKNEVKYNNALRDFEDLAQNYRLFEKDIGPSV